MDKSKEEEALKQLLTIVDELREKCPWDSKQNWDSIRPNTIEELYELLDAIQKRNANEIKKELGDVLLHILFYSKFAKEEGWFDFADVCESQCEKLIFRHPMIYGDKNGEKLTWEQIKKKEKDGNKTLLSGVPKSLPSLIKAYRIQDKVRSVGIEQPSRKETIQSMIKALERLEIEEDIEDNLQEEEWGKILFQALAATRLSKCNPENALEKQSKNFITKYDK